MIIKRLLVLQAVLLLVLGAVFLMPKFNGKQPVGVNLSLPAEIGDWYGEDRPVSDAEKQILGPDTEFARKSYTDLAGNVIYVSIVLAGQDVSTSLHRPERCLPAQGWKALDSQVVAVPVKAGPLSSIRATRLHNVNGRNESQNLYCIYYYWYVGCNDVPATPLERSLIDWRDRIFKGYNQRWAYITVAATLRRDSSSTEAAADTAIKGLIAQLFPVIWKPAAPSG